VETNNPFTDLRILGLHRLWSLMEGFIPPEHLCFAFDFSWNWPQH